MMKKYLNQPFQNSLKANFILIMVAFIVPTLATCAITLFATNTTRQTIAYQNQLLERYRLSFELNNATHDLLYRSATLASNLSDSSLDALLVAQVKLRTMSTEIGDPDFALFVQKTVSDISEGSLKALAEYSGDQRAAGDATLQTVRLASTRLQSRMLEYQTNSLEAFEATQKLAVEVNKFVGTGTTLLTFFSVLYIYHSKTRKF